MTIDTRNQLSLPMSLLDLGKPSLHALSYALRHPDTWPNGFIWDYSDCHRCAMGLAHRLWESIPKVGKDTGASVMARKFAMPYTAAQDIFMGSGHWVPRRLFTRGHLWWKEHLSTQDFARVTPDMVADHIDAYLARAE